MKVEIRQLLYGALLAAAMTAPAAYAPPALAAAAGSMTVAVPAEPETLTPRNACSLAAQFVVDNVYERLLRRQADGSRIPWLAQSFDQVDDLTWRIKLRQGVTFTNGEPVNADSIIEGVKYYLDPNIASQCIGNFGTLASATKVDDYTVDVKTKVPDPLFPTTFGLSFYVMPPQWLAATTDADTATTAIGTGPYIVQEWTKGQHLTMKANPNYWGDPKPSIDTITLVPRSEGEVRADMVKAGEADIAINITQDQASQLPAQVIEHTTQAVLIRLDTKNPILKDINVRKAIALSIDNNTLISSLFPGVSSSLNGQLARPSVAGFNPNLKPYPYDPAEAKRLVDAAGATGKELDFYIRSDLLPGVDELAEALQNMVEQSGLKINLINLEAAPWRDLLYARKEGQKRSDMLISSAKDMQFDSSLLINNYFGMGPFSYSDSQSFADEAAKAATLTGDARVAAYQALWKETYDNYWDLPIFGIDFVHGLSSRVHWQPRDDGYIFFNTATLDK